MMMTAKNLINNTLIEPKDIHVKTTESIPSPQNLSRQPSQQTHRPFTPKPTDTSIISKHGCKCKSTCGVSFLKEKLGIPMGYSWCKTEDNCGTFHIWGYYWDKCEPLP